MEPTRTCRCRTWHDPRESCLTARQAARHRAEEEALSAAARVLRRDSRLGRFTARTVVEVVRHLLERDHEAAALVALRAYTTEGTANRVLDLLAETSSPRKTG
jgi:hypothetical protein